MVCGVSARLRFRFPDWYLYVDPTNARMALEVNIDTGQPRRGKTVVFENRRGDGRDICINRLWLLEYSSSQNILSFRE
jgi:hypothetical protein